MAAKKQKMLEVCGELRHGKKSQKKGQDGEKKKLAACAVLGPGAAALGASRVSQQDVRARQGNAEEISFTPVAILLTILTIPTSGTVTDP